MFHLQQNKTLQLWLWWFCWDILAMSWHFEHLIYPARFVSRTAEIIIRIRILNFRCNFYHLIWFCCLFLTSLCPMMHTLSTLVVKWCQDSKIASFLSWNCNILATSRQSVASQSPISRRLVAEDFKAKVFMKSVVDLPAAVWPLIANF